MRPAVRPHPEPVEGATPQGFDKLSPNGEGSGCVESAVPHPSVRPSLLKGQAHRASTGSARTGREVATRSQLCHTPPVVLSLSKGPCILSLSKDLSLSKGLCILSLSKSPARRASTGSARTEKEMAARSQPRHTHPFALSLSKGPFALSLSKGQARRASTSSARTGKEMAARSQPHHTPPFTLSLSKGPCVLSLWKCLA
jgi:hypothetical protein